MKQHSFYQIRRKKHHVDQHAWAVSYVDMLTLLLCFFIIFFNADILSNEKKENLFHRISTSLDQSPKAKVRSPATQIMDQGVLQKISDASLVKKFGNLSFVQGKLIIEIPNVSFFDSGKSKLSSEGVRTVEKMLLALQPYKGLIHITVQGHTDPMSARNNLRYSDNWELSVLRATTVLKEFLSQGFDAQDLSAEGFSSNLPLQGAGPENIAHMRRITLRLEEKNGI